MSHPDDNAALLRVADEIREHEYARGHDGRQPEVDDLSRRLADAEARIAYCEANHHTDPPTNPLKALVGVRIFPQYGNKTYGRHEALFSWLQDLGVKRVTGLLDHDMAADVQAFYKRLHDELGIKVWFTVGKPRVVYTSSQWNNVKAILDGPLAGAVEQLANWNEPNHVRNTNDPPLTNWAPNSGIQQKALWNIGNTRGIDVATVQLHSGSLTKHESDLRLVAPHMEGYFNRIAWHLYPRGGVGEDLVAQFRDLYRRVLGDHPVTCTEAGYFDAVNYTGGAVRVSPEEAAEYAPAHTRLYTDQGDRIGWFELLDDPDPGDSNREASLGWIDTPSLDPATWRAKPVYRAMKTLLA